MFEKVAVAAMLAGLKHLEFGPVHRSAEQMNLRRVYESGGDFKGFQKPQVSAGSVAGFKGDAAREACAESFGSKKHWYKEAASYVEDARSSGRVHLGTRARGGNMFFPAMPSCQLVRVDNFALTLRCMGKRGCTAEELAEGIGCLSVQAVDGTGRP